MDSQLAAVPFKLGVIAPMRVVRVLAGNTVMLTRGPKNTFISSKQPLLLVSRSRRPAPQGTSLEMTARQALAGLKMISNAKIETVDQVTFAGGESVEIIASALMPKTGKPVRVVQWLRYVGDGYLMVLGIANTETGAADMKMFRNVRDGITPKGN